MARDNFGAGARYLFTTALPLTDRQQCCWAVQNLNKLCEIAETTADCDNPDRKKHVELQVEHDNFGNDWSIVYEKVGDGEAFLSLKVTRSKEHWTLGVDGSQMVLRSFIHLLKDGNICPFRCYHSNIFRLNPGDSETWVMGTVTDMLDIFKRKELRVVVHIEKTECSMRRVLPKNEFKEDVGPKAKVAVDLGNLLGCENPSGTSDFQVTLTRVNSEPRTFYLHKAILAARVPFLRRLLLGETSDAAVSSMLTNGFSERTLELVFHLIYTGRLNLLANDTIETLQELVDLAARWEMGILKKGVDRNIVRYLTFENSNSLYELSRQNGLENGLRESSSFIFRNTTEIMALEEKTKSPRNKRRSTEL